MYVNNIPDSTFEIRMTLSHVLYNGLYSKQNFVKQLINEILKAICHSARMINFCSGAIANK